MKFFNKIVDERQEQEMLKIESRGFYILLCVLIINLLIKAAMFSDIDFTMVYSEIVSALIGALFVGISCTVKGHFSRFSQPDLKTYFIYSLIAAIIVPAIGCFIKYVSVFTLIFNIVVVFIFSFTFLCIMGNITKKRISKIESEYIESPEEDEI